MILKEYVVIMEVKTSWKVKTNHEQKRKIEAKLKNVVVWQQLKIKEDA
jgi:hypothetical protein